MRNSTLNTEEKLTIIPFDQFSKLFPALQNDMGQLLFESKSDADFKRKLVQMIFESLKSVKFRSDEGEWWNLTETSLSLMHNLPLGSPELKSLLKTRELWSLETWVSLLIKGIDPEYYSTGNYLKNYCNTLFLHSPYEYKEESQNLINFLVEKGAYKPVLKRNEILFFVLLYMLPNIPSDLLRIINEYELDDSTIYELDDSKIYLVNGEKEHEYLIRALNEEEQYKPLQRKEMLLHILPHIFPTIPFNILRIISEYDPKTRAFLLIEEIKEFFYKTIPFYNLSQDSINFDFLEKYSDWTRPLFRDNAKKDVTLVKNILAALTNLTNSMQISPNDPSFEVWTSFVTGKMFYKNLPNTSPRYEKRITGSHWSTTDAINDLLITNPTVLEIQSSAKTLLPFVIDSLDRLDLNTIRDIPRILNNIRAFTASLCPLSMDIPSNYVFILSHEIEQALYNHVEDLKRGDELKKWTPFKGKIDLNNNGDKPELLIKTLKILDEKITRIEYDGAFLITPKNAETGIRILNYHKRAAVLKILCTYITENKNSLLALATKYSRQAKDLMKRLLNIPYGSPKTYVIINEINHLISTSETNSPELQKYLKVLEQVKEKLFDEIGHDTSIQSSSFSK